MDGPSFYWPQLTTDHWDVADIKNGFVNEYAKGDRRMEFYAIDSDRLRLYYHKESGGYPTTKWTGKKSNRS
jgi:hypothetical protein